MSRPLSKRMADAIKKRQPLALIAEIDHELGTKRYWTGVGLLSYNDYEWIGVGVLGKVSPIKFNTELSIQELSFVLSGVPTDEATDFLLYDIRDRFARVWLCLIDDKGKVVADPYQIVDATLDYANRETSPDGSTSITLIGRSGFYSLERAVDEVHSSEDQRRQYPDDSGLDMISSLQQKSIIWTPV